MHQLVCHCEHVKGTGTLTCQGDRYIDTKMLIDCRGAHCASRGVKGAGLLTPFDTLSIRTERKWSEAISMMLSLLEAEIAASQGSSQ